MATFYSASAENGSNASYYSIMWSAPAVKALTHIIPVSNDRLKQLKGNAQLPSIKTRSIVGATGGTQYIREAEDTKTGCAIVDRCA
jgi:hypothetical protein